MKNKTFLLLTICFLIAVSLDADQRLATLISEKDWRGAHALFADTSHLTLRDYFSGASSTRCVTYKIAKLTYVSKFSGYAEIGTITYEMAAGKYKNLHISNQIKPLFFIDGFTRYRVRDKSIAVGDAICRLTDGYFYLSEPFGQALFYRGKWRFSVTPSDEEERLTLRQLYKSEEMAHDGTWGIFILKNRGFLEGLPRDDIDPTGDTGIAPQLAIYRKYFGIQIRQFAEHWYLPFKENDNLLIFGENESLYLYDFNATLTPDTQLRNTENNRIILSYDSLTTPKIILGKRDKIDKIRLNLYYNPPTRLLSGTVSLEFSNPSAFRVLNLADSLKIRASLDQDSKGLSVIRKERSYYFLGPTTNFLSFYYSGSIRSELEYTDVFKRQTYRVETVESSPFYFLSRTQNFYPNSFIDFAEVNLTVSLPPGTDCLASGTRNESSHNSRSVYKFSSAGSKGISIACGRFSRAVRLEARIPLNVYGADSQIKIKQFHLDTQSQPQESETPHLETIQKYFDLDLLKEAFEFFIQQYGVPDLREINLLLKRGIQEGGVSNKGFIFFNYNPDQTLSQRITQRSPIILSQDPTNHLIHELAHQWWGGQLSWNSYRDVWITEGISQFSLLYFLENHYKNKRFERILRRMKRDIYRKNQQGPVIYGKRLTSISPDLNAYQNIVYNKAAFILLMLKDLMGEDKFLKRMRTLLKKYRHTSIHTSQFIQHFGENHPDAGRLLKNWIYSRKIPVITVSGTMSGSSGEVTIRQSETAFTFPLIFILRTESGDRRIRVVVRDREQTFTFQGEAPFTAIEMDEVRTLVKIKTS